MRQRGAGCDRSTRRPALIMWSALTRDMGLRGVYAEAKSRGVG